MSVLSREIGWRIVLVSQKSLGETGTSRMGKQRRSVNVADEITAAHLGEQASIFPPKELRTEEPLAVKAHVFIMFDAIRSFGLRIVVTVFGIHKNAGCWRVPIASCSASHVEYCINRKKIKARPEHMVVRFKTRYRRLGPHTKRYEGTAVESSGFSYLIE
jgi:hypothetical protein